MNATSAIPGNGVTGLLVSVRSALEAIAALNGGASIVDVKEPARGSLGRADERVIAEVVQAIGDAAPVSAALGEWADEVCTIRTPGLSYAKWGLAGCRDRTDWREDLARQLSAREGPRCVLTAYADWECAQAPPVEAIFALACEHPGSVLLIDTHCKEANNVISKRRPTLLDWLPQAWVENLCARARTSQVRIALAGSLGLAEIETLLPARPDWIAVRGVVCDGGDRQATVQTDKVRRLANLIRAPRSVSTRAG